MKITDLKPTIVWKFFHQVTQVPRPSKKEGKMIEFLESFAKEYKIAIKKDEAGNLLMSKPATPGMEDRPVVVLQSHMDMVCEKTPDCDKDMDEEGLDLLIDGDFISAKGTTLGGDDGIAVAYALAILDDDSLSHPRLEFVCTVCEEVGMEGATGIDVSMLKGKKLLNMDSEEEGVMLASCAGGCRADVKLPVERETVSGTKLTVSLSGLTGGHSGSEIDKGRGNANILMSRLLRDASAPVAIASIDGGRKDNAIPRECTAQIIVAPDEAAAVKASIEQAAAEIADEFKASDPDLKLTVSEETDCSESAISAKDSARVIALIEALPNGIIRMSREIDKLVETSLNLGVLKSDDAAVILRYAVRSSVGVAKKSLKNQLVCIAGAFAAEVTFEGDYPAWEYKKDSKLREDMVRIFEEMYGKKPTVEAIHAGVECGLLSGKIEGLDCISMGPDMYDIHTTEERLSISSAKRSYEYILRVIACK